nr:PREDICTED: synaptic vesicular amine transporter-like [Bemisia tabaci]
MFEDLAERHGPSKKTIVFIVYVSLFLDNTLLTVVVPIIPDYLFHIENPYSDVLTNISRTTTTNVNEIAKKALVEMEKDLRAENGQVGLLLSSKALLQLIMNPIVGVLSPRLGVHLSLFIGSVSLLVAALIFALGESFIELLIGRSLQGIASACIGVAGMSLVAQEYPEDKERSHVMGIVLGSVALGVLLGYPLGGLLYDISGKSTPFFVVAFAVLCDLGLQVHYLNFESKFEPSVGVWGWSHMLSHRLVVLISGALLFSTVAMAVLEPCLPLWLMSHIKPKKWQLGLVFIPDSVGYLISTNFFGPLAYKVGRWQVVVISMLIIGVSTFMLPQSKSMLALITPHFLLGLGIGAVDAALVPLLASLVDASLYSSVYALQQMAVSLAYFIGPMIGGELVRAIGFPWLLRVVGLLNILYCCLIVFCVKNKRIEDDMLRVQWVKYTSYRTAESSENGSNENVNQRGPPFQRFINGDDSD